MTDWSRKALGSKNNLNHSHLMVPTIWLVFLASKPQAITCPLSLYNRQVGICGEISHVRMSCSNTFRNVSMVPGQFKICWIRPPAMREEP